MPTPPGRGEFAAGEPRRKWKGQNAGPKTFKVRKPINTSKPANPSPIRVIPKSEGPFKPNVKLDRSQVSDRRGNSKRSGR